MRIFLYFLIAFFCIFIFYNLSFESEKFLENIFLIFKIIIINFSIYTLSFLLRFFLGYVH